MKNCFKCKENKELAQFYPHKGMTDGRLNKCVVCCRADSKSHYKHADKEKLKQKKNEHNRTQYVRQRRHRLRKDYGLTPENIEAARELQKGLCAICGKAGELVIDHDHKTGKFRGLLHRNCNSALGLLQDNPEIILSAASYVASKGVL
jgi:Recombination endonuclease VII